MEFSLLRAQRKTLTLRVLPDLSLEVRAPLYYPLEKIREFVISKQSWITRMRTDLQQRRRELGQDKAAHGSTIRYLGESLILHWEKARGKSWVRDGEKLIYRSSVEPLEEAWSKILNKWYREKAQEVFTLAFNQAWDRVSPWVRKPKPLLAIRAMKSRWGVCARSAGKITLALELIKLVPGALELVVYHELAHLKFPGHNQDFYEFLSKFLPDHWPRRQLLRRV